MNGIGFNPVVDHVFVFKTDIGWGGFGVLMGFGEEDFDRKEVALRD